MTKIEELARTIAGLYNNSRLVAPNALALGHIGPEKMEPERALLIATNVVKTNGYYFDYLDGRLIKTKVTPSGAYDFLLYDRCNGAGAGALAVEDGMTDPFYTPFFSNEL